MSQNEENPGYNAVLRYTEAAGAYSGVMFYTNYPSKQEFDKWMAEEGHKEHELVEGGVTDERAAELCSQTPVRCHVAVALHEATDPETGEVNMELARMNAISAGLAIGLVRRGLK